MRRMRNAVVRLGIALWIVAGVVLVGASAPVIAQEGTPAAIEVDTETTVTPGQLTTATSVGGGGGSAPSTVHAAGVGPGLGSSGTGPLSLGALVGAGVAAVFALWERFRSR